jgi:hypothetical protein
VAIKAKKGGGADLMRVSALVKLGCDSSIRRAPPVRAFQGCFLHDLFP